MRTVPRIVGWSAGVLGALLAFSGGALRADNDATKAPNPDTETAMIRHLLRRCTFGARPEDVEEVRRTGRDAWLDRQLHPETIPDRDLEGRLAGFKSLNYGTTDFWKTYETPATMPKVPGANDPRGPEAAQRRQAEAARLRELQRQEVIASVLLRQVYSTHQLEEVLAEFWRNHFNVDTNKDDVRYYIADWDREVIHKHLFGKFEDFLMATAKHPAMLFYLDNHVSRAPMARGEKVLHGKEKEERTAGLNENYARELMELHTLGVDNGYAQEDVIQLALVLTGWTIKGSEPDRGTFEYNDAYHAKGHKKLMTKIFADNGEQEGEEAITYLARHKNTREFICKKLVRYFVADDPPASIVNAAVDTWTKTKGDLREVYRTILTHPDFYAATAVMHKAKTPVEFVSSMLRVMHADVKAASQVLESLKDMYEGIYECEDPTGYSDRAVDWMDPGVLAVRWEFARQVLRGQVPGVDVSASPLWDGARQSPEVWEELLVDGLLAGQAPGSLTLAPFRQHINQIRHDVRKMKPEERLEAFRTCATLLFGSPEFQRQ
jgi:uncharacterized protein (DUF1800 family)